MKIIPLTQGRFALVDDEDYEFLSRHTWAAGRVRNTWYASTRMGRTRIRMHQMVLGSTEGMVIHHEDHNGLNNQKINLKRASFSENGAHQLKQKRNTSGFKGVSWNKRNKLWNTQMGSGPGRSLGYFKSKKEAAECYDRAAIEKYGEFALTNLALGLMPTGE